MRITCLGTGACYPSTTRGASCTALTFDDGDVWLFDCGEGSQIQLWKSSIRPSKINKIFITHLHGDHLFGLPGLMCTLSTMIPCREGFTMEIYGPQGLRKFVRNALNLSKSALTYEYAVHELTPIEEQYPEDWNMWPSDDLAMDSLHPQEKSGQDITADNYHIWHIFENEKASVKAGPIKHKIPSFGFVITESDEPGKLDVKKLQELGVPPGPLYGRIKKGECVTLPSGIILDPSDVLGPLKFGRKITILGDTCDTQKLVNLARSSDVVLHEATLSNSMAENAIEKGHSTPKMAAHFAHQVEAKILMLYHFSQRYKRLEMDKTLGQDVSKEETVEMLKEEAEEELKSLNSSCQVILAEDLLEYTVTRYTR